MCSPLSTGFTGTDSQPVDLVAITSLAHQEMLRGLFTLVDLGGYRKWAKKNRVTEIS